MSRRALAGLRAVPAAYPLAGELAVESPAVRKLYPGCVRFAHLHAGEARSKDGVYHAAGAIELARQLFRRRRDQHGKRPSVRFGGGNRLERSRSRRLGGKLLGRSRARKRNGPSGLRERTSAYPAVAAVVPASR